MELIVFLLLDECFLLKCYERYHDTKDCIILNVASLNDNEYCTDL